MPECLWQAFGNGVAFSTTSGNFLEYISIKFKFNTNNYGMSYINDFKLLGKFIETTGWHGFSDYTCQSDLHTNWLRIYIFKKHLGLKIAFDKHKQKIAQSNKFRSQ